jgi:hypothetical protein
MESIQSDPIPSSKHIILDSHFAYLTYQMATSAFIALLYGGSRMIIAKIISLRFRFEAGSYSAGGEAW